VLAAIERVELQQYTGIGTGLIAALLTLRPQAGVDQQGDIFAGGWESGAPQMSWLLLYQPVERSRARIATPSDLSSAIVLVSDGYGTMGVSPIRAAEVAARHGIRVHTIGIGTPYGGPAHVEGWPSIHAEFQEEMLMEIASITRGEYFYAGSARKLSRIYEQLAGEAILEQRATEITTLAAAPGLALLLAAAALSLLWFPRLP
jgi:Ca-activated chloride channel family protein